MRIERVTPTNPCDQCRRLASVRVAWKSDGLGEEMRLCLDHALELREALKWLLKDEDWPKEEVWRTQEHRPAG